ncbi:MAG: RNA polymerase sigma factor [Bacteroides sp.]
MTTKEYNESVDHFADGLYRFALRLMNNQEIAEDLVQECYTRLWERHERVQASKVRSYLFTTLYNAAIDLIRAQKQVVEVQEYHGATYELPSFDIQEHINRGLALLPEVQRTAILLRDYEGYSYEEIGEIAHLSESQVKVYIHRARQFLRKYLGTIDDLV